MGQHASALCAHEVTDSSPGALLSPRFGQIFREHHDAVARWARNLGIHPADVDDAVQEVFVVAHRRLPDFAGPGNVRAWLFSIARRVCSNYRRGRARADARSFGLERPPSPSAPDEELMRNEAFEKCSVCQPVPASGASAPYQPSPLRK